MYCDGRALPSQSPCDHEVRDEPAKKSDCAASVVKNEKKKDLEQIKRVIDPPRLGTQKDAHKVHHERDPVQKRLVLGAVSQNDTTAHCAGSAHNWTLHVASNTGSLFHEPEDDLWKKPGLTPPFKRYTNSVAVAPAWHHDHADRVQAQSPT